MVVEDDVVATIRKKREEWTKRKVPLVSFSLSPCKLINFFILKVLESENWVFFVVFCENFFVVSKDWNNSLLALITWKLDGLKKYHKTIQE